MLYFYMVYLKKNMILIRLIIFISFHFLLFADDVRYLDEVFEDFHKTEDVIYGNAPDLPFWFWVESNTVDVDLTMDVYEPVGDTITSRPVIIFAHTGAFFSGNNELDDVVDLAISASKRGYVAINIYYRLGLNILSSYSGERAVYRATQDGAAAIRYLREFPEQFKINPEQIFMWGTSAGALLALHLGYLDDEDRPEATYGGGGDPDLGCLVCEGNDYAQDPKPNAIVSCWGAIGSLDWIDADDKTPLIMFHGTADPIVPFNSGFPFTIDIALPIVYGSNLIHDRMNEMGIENELFAESGLLHEYWGTVNGNWFDGPNEYFYQIQADAYLFLYDYLDQDEFNPGDECALENGEIGFFDCDLCCWDMGSLSWLGDDWCDEGGGCAWEGPQFNCNDFGYDCGDCNDSWDGNDLLGLCSDLLCIPSYDVNDDNALDILDVIIVVNLILGLDEISCSIDYDDDGEVNVLDLVSMVDLILN